MKEQIAMIQIGQKIDDFIDDLEFEAYQNNEIKKVKFSDYEGKWLVLLFYPADFTFICPTELQEAAEYYDTFKNEGAEILSVSTDTVFVHKARRVRLHPTHGVGGDSCVLRSIQEGRRRDSRREYEHSHCAQNLARQFSVNCKDRLFPGCRSGHRTLPLFPNTHGGSQTARARHLHY